MATYDFTLILAGPTELTDEIADNFSPPAAMMPRPAVPAAPCRSTSAAKGATSKPPFGQRLPDVSSAGYVVARVEIDADAPVLKQ